MKTVLSDSDRRALVAYRIQRAKETLREVDYLIEGDFYNAAVSRLYYACYYMAVALLVAHKLETQTHAGVKNMLSLHFVKKGLLDTEIAKIFFRLFDLRHNNDYEDYCFCDCQTLSRIRPQADIFINAIEALLSDNTPLSPSLPE